MSSNEIVDFTCPAAMVDRYGYLLATGRRAYATRLPGSEKTFDERVQLEQPSATRHDNRSAQVLF
jgi:hypothetical protein